MARELKVYQALFDYDDAIREQYPVFCGVDEAGRGPLAGDVYAAAVILPPGLVIPGLNDSKKMSEARREQLNPIIKEKALAWAVGIATVAEIERINILQAALLAMRRAVEGLSAEPSFALVDGNQPPDLPVEVGTLVHGDAVSASIAAASVLAKTERDAALRALDKQYPQYGFSAHKGYGTKAHYEAIAKYGMCPAHRPSFLRKFYEQQGK